MKAEDTVMPRVNIFRGSTPKPVEQVEELLREQAEISYKAGYEQSVLDNDNWARETYGYEQGRREVVEAMFEESYGDPRVTDYYKINYDEWQAKLKEWGIK